MRRNIEPALTSTTALGLQENPIQYAESAGDSRVRLDGAVRLPRVLLFYRGDGRMPALVEDIREPKTEPRQPGMAAKLLLVRAACDGGATRAMIVRDLGPLFSHKLSPAEWRQMVEAVTAELLDAHLVSEKRGRLIATDEGLDAATTFLGRKQGTALGTWPDTRDTSIVAKALGLEGQTTARLKSLARPEALSAKIVQQAFGLPQKKNESAARIRARLALIALERAFGNKIKTGFGSGSALSAKAGRLLAGHLSGKPRDFASDAKLITELAAEQINAPRADLAQLRLGVLRKFTAQALEERRQRSAQAKRATVAPPAVAPVADNDIRPVRPDVAQFASAIQAAAATCADGWPGNRKSYISKVWDVLKVKAPHWGLSEIEFKCMLAEAHRSGHVVLASADLKNKQNIQELESSAISYKNTVWHFVRVED